MRSVRGTHPHAQLDNLIVREAGAIVHEAVRPRGLLSGILILAGDGLFPSKARRPNPINRVIVNKPQWRHNQTLTGPNLIIHPRTTTNM